MNSTRPRDQHDGETFGHCLTKEQDEVKVLGAGARASGWDKSRVILCGLRREANRNGNLVEIAASDAATARSGSVRHLCECAARGEIAVAFDDEAAQLVCIHAFRNINAIQP